MFVIVCSDSERVYTSTHLRVHVYTTALVNVYVQFVSVHTRRAGCVQPPGENGAAHLSMAYLAGPSRSLSMQHKVYYTFPRLASHQTMTIIIPQGTT